MKAIETSKSKLHKEGYTCVIYNNDICVYSSYEKGVKPLMDFINTYPYSDCEDLVLADKVIGKAAALLCVMIGIKNLYADVISKEAIKILEKHGIGYFFEKEVLYIKNRTGDGKCPMEGLSVGVDNPQDMFNKIMDFIISSKK